MAHSDLVARREAIMDAADRALDAARPHRQGADYVTAMQSAATELEQIAAAMRSAGLPAVEQSRTHRYRGSVLSDLAPALGKGMLERARAAYRLSEALLEGHRDPLERAKLDFNLGNLLRQVDHDDLAQLREAESRLLAAKAVFEGSAPGYLPRVEEALSSIRSLLAIAPVARTVTGAKEELESLSAEIASGADPNAIASKLGELMRRDGGVAAMLLQVRARLEDRPDSARTDPRYAEVLSQLESAGSLVVSGAGQAHDSAMAEILHTLGRRVECEAEDGRLTGDRSATLLATLSRLAGVVRSESDDIPSLMKSVEDMRSAADAFFEVNHYLSHGMDRPPAGSRSAQLVELCWSLRRWLMREAMERNKTRSESSAVTDLLMRATQLDRRIYEVGGDDARAVGLERESLRPLAVEVRKFAGRHHALLARPYWTASRVPIDPNAVLFSGSREVRSRVVEACRARQLDLKETPKGDDVATARWLQLQRSALAVFDLSVPVGPARAAVGYELGVARALGRPVVVLARHDQTIPFDVDVTPTLLYGDHRDDQAIAEVLDEASVWLMPRPRSGTLPDTIDDVLRRYPTSGSGLYVGQTLKLLRRLRDEPSPLDDRLDPLAIQNALETLVVYLAEPAPMLLHPVWPPLYREDDRPRLFHVMPFQPDWSKAAKQSVKEQCESAGAAYWRGDEVPNPDVIRSIWFEINFASHVLVDLTDFNVNVALELGIAHTIGRRTLIVGQKGTVGSADTVGSLFPMIAKHRFHPYASVEGPELPRLVERFLTDPSFS